MTEKQQYTPTPHLITWKWDIVGNRLEGVTVRNAMTDKKIITVETQEAARRLLTQPDLLAAARELLHEIDQVYDVDGGQPNIPGWIMEKIPALRAAIAQATA